jgi:hypothetical protein
MSPKTPNGIALSQASTSKLSSSPPNNSFLVPSLPTPSSSKSRLDSPFRLPSINGRMDVHSGDETEENSTTATPKKRRKRRKKHHNGADQSGSEVPETNGTSVETSSQADSSMSKLFEDDFDSPFRLPRIPPPPSSLSREPSLATDPPSSLLSSPSIASFPSSEPDPPFFSLSRPSSPKKKKLSFYEKKRAKLMAMGKYQKEHS